MTKPIPDKAEVALEYPDKLYIGTFEQSARFDAHLDETGISLSLHRTGADDVRKSIRMHFTTVCSPTFCAIWRRRSARSRRAISPTARCFATPRRPFIRRCKPAIKAAATRRLA